MKPSDTRLQHARVWSAAKLLQRGNAIVTRLLAFLHPRGTAGGERIRASFAEDSRETAKFTPTVRDLAILSTRVSNSVDYRIAGNIGGN